MEEVARAARQADLVVHVELHVEQIGSDQAADRRHGGGQEGGDRKRHTSCERGNEMKIHVICYTVRSAIIPVCGEYYRNVHTSMYPLYTSPSKQRRGKKATLKVGRWGLRLGL